MFTQRQILTLIGGSNVPSVKPVGLAEQAFKYQAPDALPVVRFLLYERAYPDSVAASVDATLEVLQRVGIHRIVHIG